MSAVKVSVVVKPRSGRQEVVEKEEGWTVFLKSPAQDNKANVELVKLLRKHTGKSCRIVAGLTSRRKVVEFLEN